MDDLKNIHLKRNLENRHIQFISLGGTVGTGLFLGAGSTIAAAGPSVILGYLITGIIVFLIMRQLGEMRTNEHVAGSSCHFAYEYWDKFPGFLAGWNYWVEYILSGMVELTAIATYTHYWFPNIPTWETTLFFFLFVNVVNLLTVKAFGEVEFLFSAIKVTAVCLIILIGGYIIFFNPSLVPVASIKNLWQTASGQAEEIFKGFFPHGFIGFLMAFPIIIFAFDGTELIGLTAAEAADPKRTIPKAVNQVAYRILIFYIGSFLVLLSLYHWSKLSMVESPFVMIFDRIGFKYTASFLNFIILTAALSVYNSCIYCNSRMLYGLALQKNAPQIFKKTNKRGVPSPAIIFSGALTFLVVPLNYIFPNWVQAFEIIISFALVGIILNWGIMIMAHLYRQYKEKHHQKILFPAPFYPWSSYIAIGFLAFVLCSMALPQFGNFKQVIAVPIWVLVVWIWYKLRGRKANASI